MKHVNLITNKGNILLELDDVKAPITVANFIDYVNSGFYNGLIFHRVIKNFMIQAGGFLPDMIQQRPTKKTIDNEAKNRLKNDKHTIAMARTNDPHSAASQFFINSKRNEFLDYPGQDGWGYAVFGKVIAGEDIVDEIGDVPVTRRGLHSDVPVEPIVIEKAEVITLPGQKTAVDPSDAILPIDSTPL